MVPGTGEDCCSKITTRTDVAGRDAVADTDGPVGAEAVYETVRPHVPARERHRHAHWEAHWRECTARLLTWCVEFRVLDRTPEGLFELPERD